MSLRTSTATVYHGHRRRFFSKDAAANDIANAIIRKRCECSNPDYSTGDPGEVCEWHSNHTRFARAKHLLKVMFILKGVAE